MRNVERLRTLWRTKRQKLRLRQLGAHLLYERLAPRVRSLKKGGRVCKELLRKEIAVVMVPLTQFGVRKLLCSTKSTGLVGMVSLTGEATQQPNERLDGRRELREHGFKRVALQFPEEDAAIAPLVCHEVRELETKKHNPPNFTHRNLD